MTTTDGAPRAIWAFAEHEHRDLTRGIDRVHDLACEIGGRSLPELSLEVREVLGWLDRALEPHIAWEEGWLYPEIDARLGTMWATRAARFDHQQVRGMAARLRKDESTMHSGLSGDLQADTRCHLFSLEALLRAHIEREERFLMPLLDEDWTPGAGSHIAPPIRTTG
jgi:iron-sulfur cluster repair protein YtfE (RIC family)